MKKNLTKNMRGKQGVEESINKCAHWYKMHPKKS